MKKLIVLVLVVLSGCVHAGVERLGTIGDPELLPERVKPSPVYQITSKGSNSPKVTVLATHDCAVKFETVPVLVEHMKDGVKVQYRDHRVTEIYDCGVNTLAWANEGSTKAQLINLGQTAIQGGAFASGMRLLRPARYNSTTTMSGGNSTSAGGDASAAGGEGGTGLGGQGGGGGTGMGGHGGTGGAGGGTVEGNVSQSNDIER